jgi:outer membrane protein TolC
VDLWGQIRRSIESANALAQVQVADYENVLLTLKSDVAEYYIMLRYIDREQSILRDNIDLQQKALGFGRPCGITAAWPAAWTSPRRQPC